MSYGVGSVLDEVGVALDRRDPGGMLRHIAALPQQLRSGWQLTRDLRLPEA